jgi:hypothetical protein
MNFDKKEIENIFPSIQGKGEEIRNLISEIGRNPKALEILKKDFPDYVEPMVYNNFIAPLTASDITTEESKKIVKRLNLFCASIF